MEVNIEYSINGYTLFTNNPMIRGVAIYVSNELDPSLFTFGDAGTVNEMLWCTLIVNGFRILVGTVYRNMNYNKVQFVENISDVFLKLHRFQFDIILITGDFNFPMIDWKLMCNVYPEANFQEAIRDAFLTQLIDEPTRHRFCQNSNILDLVICNDDDCIDSIEHLAPLGRSDHDVIRITLNLSVRDETNKLKRFDYHKGDYEGCKKEISSIDWNVLTTMNIDEAWIFLKNKLKDLELKYIPTRSHKNNQRPLWMNGRVKKHLNKKNKLFKKYLKHKSIANYNNYVSIRNATKYCIKDAVALLEKNVANGSKTKNPKLFWKYVNTKLKRKTGLSNLIKTNGEMTNNDYEKAEALNEYFSSVFVDENMSNIPTFTARNECNEINEFDISETCILSKLLQLNVAKSMGPDNLHPHFLKNIAKEISLPLSVIFNKSLHERDIPNDWRVANVTAIYKNGNRNNVKNYRPISLTCILCKLFESIIKDSIMDYLKKHGMLSDCQHGFRHKRSCDTQLLEVMEDFTKLIDNKETIDVIYLDFCKAFDSVPHERLFVKLGAYGIGGNLLGWIKSFLKSRSQRVTVGNHSSSFRCVKSGVPQGSVLGPLLFILYVNDLPDAIHSNCKLFADDTKIYSASVNFQTIQNDVYSLFRWSDKWQLDFNKAKCKVMHIGKNNPMHSYYINLNNSETLSDVETEKDVGIVFDRFLNFDMHILAIVNKTTNSLEYGNCIWSPIFKRQSIIIENVQRRATKRLSGFENIPYVERLNRLKLPTLKYRRRRGDLILLYKLVHGLHDIDYEHFFEYSPITFTRGDKFKIFMQRCSTNIRQNSFIQRTIKTWNELKFETKNSESINCFKNAIDRDLHALRYEYDE